MSFNVRLEGIDELLRDWDDGVAQLGSDVRKGVSSALAAGKAVARAAVPVKTGALRSKISARLTSTSAREAEGEIVADRDYAAPVEYGSRAHDIPNAFGRGFTAHHPGARAQPFMAPAERAADVELQRSVDQASARFESRFR